MIATIISIAAIIIPAYFAWRSIQKKQAEIHVLVNDRLDSALNRIGELQGEIETLHGTVERLGGPRAEDQ